MSVHHYKTNKSSILARAIKAIVLPFIKEFPDICDALTVTLGVGSIKVSNLTYEDSSKYELPIQIVKNTIATELVLELTLSTKETIVIVKLKQKDSVLYDALLNYCSTEPYLTDLDDQCPHAPLVHALITFIVDAKYTVAVTGG